MYQKYLQVHPIVQSVTKIECLPTFVFALLLHILLLIGNWQCSSLLLGCLAKSCISLGNYANESLPAKGYHGRWKSE